MNHLLKSLKNPIVQQYAVELLFPIIGYFFFGWSFLLIVLFYLVDQLGNQINFFARLRFVQVLFLPKKKWLFLMAVIIFMVLFATELYMIFRVIISTMYDCQIHFFYVELKDFFVKEFWLFLPLLVFANYFKDKMTFYKTDLPYQQSPEKMVIFNVVGLLGAFVLITLIAVIWLIFKPNLLLLIVLIAVLKLLNDVFIMPKVKLRYFKKI